MDELGDYALILRVCKEPVDFLAFLQDPASTAAPPIIEEGLLAANPTVLSFLLDPEAEGATDFAIGRRPEMASLIEAAPIVVFDGIIKTDSLTLVLSTNDMFIFKFDVETKETRVILNMDDPLGPTRVYFSIEPAQINLHCKGDLRIVDVF